MGNNKSEKKETLTVKVSFTKTSTNYEGQTRNENGQFSLTMEAEAFREWTSEAIQGALTGLGKHLSKKVEKPDPEVVKDDEE